MWNARSAFVCLTSLGLAFCFSEEPALATVKISDKATQNMSCSSGICSPTAKDAVLNISQLAGILESNDVTVKSDSVAQDIEIDAPLSWASSHRLTLDSHRSITFNRPISVTGTGAVMITTNDGGTGGDFRFLERGHIKFWDLKSSLIINGQSYALVAHVKDIGRVGFPALARSMDLRNQVYTSAPVPSFGGSFGNILEGLGNTISHLTVHAGANGCAGLICNLFGTVRDVGLVNVDITAGDVTGAGAVANAIQFRGIIANSYATGTLSAGSRSALGGLAAVCSGSIRNSYAAVTRSAGDDSKAGGLVGSASGSIDQSYSSGSGSSGNGAMVGGLVGASNGATISNSYATDSVSGTAGANVGGLIGLNENNNGDGFVHSSYATGAVSGGQGATLGGLIGDDESSGSIANSYWDLDTSGIANPHQGAGNIPDDPGITGLTDAQLKSGLPTGFSGKIWRQKPTVNNGYPYLAQNPPQ